MSTAGTPNASDALGYSAWAAANSVSDSIGTADLDGDGLTSLMEYFLGTNPSAASPGALPTTSVQTISVLGVPASYLTLTVTHALGRDDAALEVQSTTDLANVSGWAPAILVTATHNGNGTETLVYRCANPTSAAASQFMRARVTRL